MVRGAEHYCLGSSVLRVSSLEVHLRVLAILLTLRSASLHRDVLVLSSLVHIPVGRQIHRFLLSLFLRDVLLLALLLNLRLVLSLLLLLKSPLVLALLLLIPFDARPGSFLHRAVLLAVSLVHPPPMRLFCVVRIQ